MENKNIENSFPGEDPSDKEEDSGKDDDYNISDVNDEDYCDSDDNDSDYRDSDIESFKSSEDSIDSEESDMEIDIIDEEKLNNITENLIKTIVNNSNKFPNNLQDQIKDKIEELKRFKLKNNPDNLTDEQRILLSDMNLQTKINILDKINSDSSDEEGVKVKQWVNSFLKIPFNKYKKLPVDNSNSPKEISDFLSTCKKKLDTVVHGVENAKQEIMSFISKRISNPDSRGNILALRGVKGTAKCLGYGVKIVLPDETLIEVQNLKVGDKILGDNNDVRTVLNIASDKDIMYMVKNNYGIPFTANKEHILCLKNKITRRILEIKIKNYIMLPSFIKKLYFSYKNPINILNNYEEKLHYIKNLVEKTGNIYIRKLKKNKEYYIPKSSENSFIVRSLGFTIIRQTKYFIFFTTNNFLDPIELEFLGMGNYYGFTLDGNGRFVLEDCSVSHNTRLIRKGVSEALGLPFYSINFGGLKDSSQLTGFNFAYVGSSYGNIVNALIMTGCMNPIIYLDEIDKISELDKATEIFGVLTHLLDEEQNNEFEDYYYSGIKIDLSKVLFVISFNNIENIDEIVSDRMRIIDVEPPSPESKIKIVRDIMLPEITEQNKNIYVKYIWPEQTIKHILTKTNEKGMRETRENIKGIIEKLNLDFFSRGMYNIGVYSKYCENNKRISYNIDDPLIYNINEEIVNKLVSSKKDNYPEHMYM